jgi:DNA-binding XRE family transcriptional regulator
MMRRARLEGGLTQGEMATALSASLGKSIVRTQVVSWEVGRNLPGICVIVAALSVVPAARLDAVTAELLAPLTVTAAA